MWTIRQEQVDALRQSSLLQFEERTASHLQKFAPAHWRVIGELDRRKVIRLGVDRAKHYGFTLEGPVRFYIELMFMFGSYFDTDPLHPWAKEVLLDASPLHEMVRAEHLYEAMNAYLDQVSGPGHCHSIEAMQRLSQTRLEDVANSNENASLEKKVLFEFKAIYPQKCNYLGDSPLYAVIRHAFNLTLHYGMVNDMGKVLMALLGFAVGHGFHVDPLYGWIARELAGNHQYSPDVRTKELYTKAMLYLRHAISEGGKR